MITAERYHDISCGHRVVGHESKCRHLHGHNYRVHFAVVADRLDEVGRVVDFSVIKKTLCRYLEEQWDHKMLIWSEDPLLPALREIDPEGICVVPFNPTAENMAEYLLHTIAPPLLEPHHCTLHSCRLEETRKCSATVTL